MTARHRKAPKQPPSFYTNKMRMEYLVKLPEFQKEVAHIRTLEFDILPTGFASDEQVDAWQKKLNSDEKNFAFGERLRKLGAKFNLPSNFIEWFGGGLRAYVLRNQIIPPARNYVIEHQPAGRKGKTDFLSIKTFAFLDNQELREAGKELKQLQVHYFKPEVVLPVRSRNQSERDLVIFDRLIKRQQKPVKSARYRGYLATLKRNVDRGLVSAKEFKKRARQKELQHEIYIGYDEITARQVAKELKITTNAVKQAYYRVRILMRNWFGIKIG